MNLSTLSVIGGVFLVLISAASHASTELTLLCNIKTRFEYNGRHGKTLDISTRIEVAEYPSQAYLSIIPDSDDLPSVSTRSVADREVSNFSTPQKWHLSNRISREGGVSHNEFIIDRVAGTISFNGLFEAKSGNTVSRVGFGLCKKVEAGQRKF